MFPIIKKNLAARCHLWQTQISLVQIRQAKLPSFIFPLHKLFSPYFCTFQQTIAKSQSYQVCNRWYHNLVKKMIVHAVNMDFSCINKACMYIKVWRRAAAARAGGGGCRLGPIHKIGGVAWGWQLGITSLAASPLAFRCINGHHRFLPPTLQPPLPPPFLHCLA